MKYLRSLMQQSVTACKNQAKLIQQFTLSLLYLLIIHIVALLFFFLFRLVLFTSIDYQFPPDIQNNFLMQATAFIKGLWFDNVIACYILLLPLGEFYQFNLSSCIRQQNSLTAQFVSFSLANLANIFYPPPDFYNN